MNKTQRLALVLALALATIALAVAIVAILPAGFGPAPGPDGLEAAGDTNFTNVVASGDLTAGDDLTVGDDVTITDALSAADLAASDDLTVGDAVTIGGITTVPTDTEHIGLYTVDAASITTGTNGALWTVGATEVWYIERIVCHITEDFGCEGDDCTLNIGLTGGDVDGFLDLDDAELQAADTEITGLPAGWQGFGSTDTRGAFFAAGGGVIMTNDTIDVALDDTGGTNPSAGTATCYVVYLRIQ